MTAHAPATHYLVGGGISSLAAAVFLIRDAGVRGGDIVLFEQEDAPGGSLDGSGTPDTGYLVRGGRMFEKHFVCTFDLLGSIPLPDASGRTLKDDIETFNREVRGSSRCRLVRGARPDDPSFGLKGRDRFDLMKFMAAPESSLAGRTIESCFSPAFFESNFWVMWATTFAFQTWHSATELRRYFRRFIHLFPEFKRLGGVLRTRYNQYDSIIAPICAWLKGQGVRFETGTRVLDADLESKDGRKRIPALHIRRRGRDERLAVRPEDRVYLTLGSMTAGSSTGTNTAPPAASDDRLSWDFWTRLAARDPAFGRPDVFCGNVAQTRWESFTVTLPQPAFFDFMEGFTGNVAGTGGLVTFARSGWMMSVVLFNQPHFAQQPEDVFVFWGYGLRGDRKGDFVRKPMAECTGQELLQELAGQLGVSDRVDELFKDATIIPCMMPYITSQFMPRRPGDRPVTVPEGAGNFAILGQFCEQERDVVFTVEYSVRSAKQAVHALAGGPRPPHVVRTDRNPAALSRALWTLLSG